MQEGGGGGWLKSRPAGKGRQMPLSGMESRFCDKPLAIKKLRTNSAQVYDLKEECTGEGVRPSTMSDARKNASALIATRRDIVRDGVLHLAVLDAIGEVDDHADNQPDHQPHPSRSRQEYHHEQ